MCGAQKGSTALKSEPPFLVDATHLTMSRKGLCSQLDGGQDNPLPPLANYFPSQREASGIQSMLNCTRSLHANHQSLHYFAFWTIISSNVKCIIGTCDYFKHSYWLALKRWETSQQPADHIADYCLKLWLSPKPCPRWLNNWCMADY